MGLSVLLMPVSAQAQDAAPEEEVELETLTIEDATADVNPNAQSGVPYKARTSGDWLAFFLRLRQQFIAAGAPTDEAGQPWEPSGVPEARLGRHDEDWNYARDYLQGLAPASVAAAPASA